MSPQSAPEQPSSDQAQCDYYEPSHVTDSLFRAPVEWSAQFEVIAVIGELEYWVPPTSDPLLSTEIQDLLRPYREYSV